MIIDYIHESAAVEPVMRAEYFFGFFGGRVLIGEGIDGPVQGNAMPDTGRVVEFLFTLYKITDQVACQDLRVPEG